MLDVLFAVALGEGFFSGMYELKDKIVTGAVWTAGVDGQNFFRFIHAFLIVLFSWLHYRRATG